jgi:RNA polymerase sigma factor (sigma-70 family)
MVVQASLAKETFALSPVPAHPLRERNFRLIPGKKAAPKIPSTESLILEHREIAWRLARRMINRWGSRIEADELRSLTDIALCEAAARYRHDAGAAFMTFFFYHLKGCLVKSIALRTHQQLLLVDDIETLIDGHSTIAPKRTRSSFEETGHRRGAPLVATHSLDNTFEDAIIMRDLVNKCVLATSKLRGLDREVIKRVYVQGEDLNSLPDSLGFSRGHIFRVRSRAITKLKRMLKA